MTVNLTPFGGATSTYSFGTTGVAAQILANYVGTGTSIAAGTAGAVTGNIYAEFVKKYGNTADSEYYAFVSALAGKNVSDRSTADSALTSVISANGKLKGGVGANYTVGSQYGGGGSSSGNGQSGASPNIVIGSGGIGVPDVTSAFEQSAYGQVQLDLDNWGLTSLGPLAMQLITDPGNHLDAAEVLDVIRQQPAYQQAFYGKPPGMTELSYLQNKQSIQDQLNGAGITGFTSQQIGTMIGNGIYGTTLTDRINKGYQVAMAAPAETRTLLNQYYGINTSDLASYYLDPTTTNQQWEQQTRAAVIGTEAMQTGFGNLSQAQSAALAAQNISDSAGRVDASYYLSGFSKAAALTPLEQSATGTRGQTTVSQQQLIDYAFPGSNATGGTNPAQEDAALKLALGARAAGLSGGGGYNMGAKGTSVGRAATEGIQGRP